jgi:hypothetical protein
MNISEAQARKLLPSLYNVAEKDKNDIIANAASALAVKFESARRTHVISEVESRLLGYVLKQNPITNEEKKRRKTYKRRVTLA